MSGADCPGESEETHMDESLKRMFDLSGRTAVVTGVSRGLGISFARGLTKAGCDLTIVARNLDRLKQVAEELRGYGHRIVPLKVDVTSRRDVGRMVSTTVSEFGTIDILVNNAGIATVVEAEDMTEDQWKKVLDTNITGLFFCVQAVGRQMLRQGHGKIINIASMYGINYLR
jgi:2-deoxy-D-gluconate 3-dehydrogenase